MKRKKRKGKAAPAEVLSASRRVVVNRPIPLPVSDGSIGAPTKYSPELVSIICERVAGGESINQLSRDPTMPARSTIRHWLLDPEKEDFRVAYARAKKA